MRCRWPAPNIFWPEYFLARTFDGLHLTPKASALLGAHHGRAIAKYLSGKGGQPLHITSVTRVEKVVTLHFAGGDGPVVFHRERGHKDRIFGVRDLENNGVSRTQLDCEAPHIKHLRITGPRKVTLVLSQAPKRALALPPPFAPKALIAISLAIRCTTRHCYTCARAVAKLQ